MAARSRLAWKVATMSSNSAALVAVGIALLVTAQAHGAEDLRALRVEPLRGQSPEQLRRDRYECHNWAVEQTGQTPVGMSSDEAVRAEEKTRRAERAERAAGEPPQSDYLRALTACLEGRGYGASLPAGSAAARRR